MHLTRHHRITGSELAQVFLALLVAIALQLATRKIGSELLPGSQYVIIFLEVGLAGVIGLTVNHNRDRVHTLHRSLAVILLAIISAANISSLVYVLHSLIVGSQAQLSGERLLTTAIAIFITNIIVFALWYWEIDSPGLTRSLWSKHDKDFQFTEQDLASEFPDWQPRFPDYLYLSVTNAVNFAPADTRPLTGQAKLLMASQSLVSVFTIALVVARSVSILGS